MVYLIENFGKFLHLILFFNCLWRLLVTIILFQGITHNLVFVQDENAAIIATYSPKDTDTVETHATVTFVRRT